VFWFRVGKVLVPEFRFLLVNVWVSLVPTIVPDGAVTEVIVLVALPTTTPVRVAAPVPP
jgi:hypothetical protein